MTQKLYVVHRTRSGYAREDAKTSDVVGVFTDPETARKVALLSYGKYELVELDYIMPGIRAAAPEYGLDFGE